MRKLIKSVLIFFMLIIGISFSTVAVAAPAIMINGEFDYKYDLVSLDWKLTMASGTIGGITDLSPGIISDGEDVKFTATWNGAAFGDFKLSKPDETPLLLGTMDTFNYFQIPGNIHIFNSSYTITSGDLMNQFSPIIDFSAILAELNIPFPDMATPFEGTLNATFSSRVLSTPIPSSLTCLGLGLIAFAGLRRTKSHLPKQRKDIEL